MLSHCLKCRQKTDIKNPRAVKTKNGNIMILSNVWWFVVVTNRNLSMIKKLVE